MKATNIELASDLYKAGLDEDGYDYEAELYYVVIDLDDCFEARSPTAGWY